MSNGTLGAIVAAACACAPLWAGAAPKATVEDLAWMTGTWAGPLDDSGQVLEENWIVPRAGSMAALVRMVGQDATSMVELIVIEEEGDSLALHIQQWDAGFSPRTPAAQKLMLRAIGENRVSWEAVGEGGMRSLAYARPAPDTFTIDVETADGKFHVELKATGGLALAEDSPQSER